VQVMYVFFRSIHSTRKRMKIPFFTPTSMTQKIKYCKTPRKSGKSGPRTTSGAKVRAKLAENRWTTNATFGLRPSLVDHRTSTRTTASHGAHATKPAGLGLNFSVSLPRTLALDAKTFCRVCSGVRSLSRAAAIAGHRQATHARAGARLRHGNAWKDTRAWRSASREALTRRASLRASELPQTTGSCTKRNTSLLGICLCFFLRKKVAEETT